MDLLKLLHNLMRLVIGEMFAIGRKQYHVKTLYCHSLSARRMDANILFVTFQTQLQLPGLKESWFNQVPLIEMLVKTFESLFPHLSIHQVWLLCKSTHNDGFQGWHQDMVKDLTQTIVINLGSEVKDDQLERGKIPLALVPVETLHASNSSDFEEEDVEDCFFVQGEVALRCDAMLKKNCNQEQNAMKATQQCGEAVMDSGCGVGTIVSLKVDYWTNCHAPGLLAIVFAARKETGGKMVCCEHSIITHDGSK